MQPNRKKSLIICSVCATNGKREVLGEITPKGFIIGRVLNKQKYTIVISRTMAIVCGECQEVVFIKHEANSKQEVLLW